ncbi:hypothetical protein ABID92_002032 [Frigoribacterium sp. PvP120]|uniref:hypothetical protein n=1 Tax=unclassified Frigoribacterium TaxID=2627005 RepID=UPI001AE36BF8|nr:hypothetical protein [Frigoribacterium sp. PvP121]MBP1240334.1 hypothetical protein [Frigoribacterium sp. PvP121]
MADSRKGDRFHYVWAAIQSLKLLDQRSGLTQVYVEGAAGEPVPGDEIIDLAEYYAQDSAAHRVVVRQLKYSTRRSTKPLGLSDLGPTFRKFSQIDRRRYDALRIAATSSAEYVITSNRPVAASLQNAIKRIVMGETVTANSIAAKLLTWLETDQRRGANLLRRLSFDGSGSQLAALRAQLEVSTAELTGDADSTVHTVLLDQVIRRASGELRGPIDLSTVAFSFAVTPDDLVPAPNLIPTFDPAVDRTVYRELADAVIASTEPTVISAAGGVGKTTFAAALPALLEERAVVIIYDCFGNGSYRAPDKPRHRHRDALVQIASELAAKALSVPLIPRPGTGSHEYVKAFVHRVREARLRLEQKSPGVDLVIVVDAGDNAVIAAEARGDQAFVHDLLQIDPIEGVRIVVTARPYRVDNLRAPSNVTVLHLPEFAIDETASMLRSVHPDATENDVAEFHRRTSANPRIQALVLSETATLRECLNSLTGLPQAEDDPVAHLLERQLETVLEAAGGDRSSLDFAGQLLATLRPRIPISVIASLTGRDGSLIRSFVSDLGRGLVIGEDTVQFLDEPTETFFRRRYPLAKNHADRVVQELTSLSSSNGYAAASLPQVLWEAERFADLAALALSDSGLPVTSEVERRQIAQLRTSFALRAAIKIKDPAAIVQLAMLAGAAAASAERRYTLLRDNADLTGEVIDGATLDEIRAAHLLPSEWPGSVLNAEAVMLAVNEDRKGDALNRLRGAHAALLNRVQGPAEDREGKLEPKHGANIALAMTWLKDEKFAARYLEDWEPPRWVFEQATVTARVLLARGEQDYLARIGTSARTSALTLAIAAELQKLGLLQSREHAYRAWRTLRGPRVGLNEDDYAMNNVGDGVLRGVAWITANSVRHGVATARQGVNLLTKYLPETTPPRLGDYRGRDNAGLLCAYALRASLRGDTLTVADLQPLSDGSHRNSRDDEKSQLDALLPWLQGWSEWALGRSTETDIQKLLNGYPRTRSSYRDPVLLRRIAGPWSAQFAHSSHSAEVVSAFRDILGAAQGHSGLFVATDMIASLQGDERFVDSAYACALASAASAEAEPQAADQIADDLVRVARATYMFDKAEAHAYFAKAVGIVSRVGDDAWEQWESIVSLAREATVDDDAEAFLLAKRLADAAERLEPYMYSGFDMAKLLAALQRITGPRTFAIVSQWRDRGFGSFGSHIGVLRDQANASFADRAELSIGLSAFADEGGLETELAALTESRSMTDERFSAIQHIAWARGGELAADDVDPDWAVRFNLKKRRRAPESDYLGVSHDDAEWQAKRESQLESLREALRSFDLGSSSGMADAAAAIRDNHLGSNIDVLTFELDRRPSNTWASILRAFASEDSFSAWQRFAFIRGVSKLRSTSQAFRSALRELGEDYLRRYASDVMAGFSRDHEPSVLAAVLQTDERSILLQALAMTDAEVVVSSAGSCYRLASGVAPLLTAPDAVRALTGALGALETALELDPWTSAGVAIPGTADPDSAIAACVWSALGDPRASTRWRATHAARFLIAFGAEEAVLALAAMVLAGPPAGYLDPRFPFYEWHAVEGFLVAVERVAVDDPSMVAPLLASITALSAANPDHAHMQHICKKIAQHCRDADLDRSATMQRASIADVHTFERPRAPKPFGHDAVKSEFLFHFDFEEYAIAPLSESFRTTHEEVLRSMSGLILDEWGYGKSPEVADDPRLKARAYDSEETYFYKCDVPKAEDFKYYLSYHAMMTTAGRMLTTTTRFRDPDEQTDAFDEWFARFDLGREDRRWTADARRPVPEGHERRQHNYGDGWLWRISANDFTREFVHTDGWITVWSAAQQSETRSWDNTSVASALVARDTAGALLTALQSASTFTAHRLPLTDDEDFTFDIGSFQLRGWIDSPHNETGIDRKDEFARDVQFPTPRPSTWITDTLQLSQSDDGMNWNSSDGALVGTAESWSSKSWGRDSQGPHGTRLRVSTDLLAEVATRTGMAVILEVRIDRHDESIRHGSNDDYLGYLDDYVKFFLFAPDLGWRDAGGRPVAGPADCGQPR